jgi:hypothetical protein
LVRVLPASEPERGQLLPAAQLRQPLLLLLLGAERVDRPGAERLVRGHRDRHGGVHAGELLHGDGVREVVGAAAAVLLRERHAHQAQAGQLLHDLVREAMLAIELLRHRPHLLVGEVPDQALDVLLLVCEIEVQARASVFGRRGGLGSLRFTSR